MATYLDKYMELVKIYQEIPNPHSQEAEQAAYEIDTLLDTVLEEVDPLLDKYNSGIISILDLYLLMHQFITSEITSNANQSH